MIENKRIYLSPPSIDTTEIENVVAALNSGWISPFGHYITEFSNKLSQLFSEKNILLTNNGTSALHLALKTANIKEGDYVLCSDFTFAATAFPIVYEKAIPVLLGPENDTWNISPYYLEQAISDLKRKNITAKAIIIAHIYGMPAKMEEIISICNDNNILIIEDAAEALGSRYKNIPLGNLGNYGVLSFNGNKIITCSTGGALILPDKESFAFAEKIANQAKEKLDYYQHNNIGYNYAQSNILAAIGSAQFNKLNEKVSKRREVFNHYLSFLSNNFALDFQKENNHSFSNRWLSSFVFNSNNLINKKIKQELEKNNIESRYLWNPLHRQAPFKDYYYYGDSEQEFNLFEKGISLPSGDNMCNNDLDRIIETIKNITS